MSKLFQIHEDDLNELERITPELMQEHADLHTAREKTRWRRLRQIIGNVRWNYGPWQECERVQGLNPLDEDGESP